MITAGHFENGLQPWSGSAGADALEALVHQDAVVGIQRHHVSNTAQRHQIEQFANVRLWLRLVPPKAAQASAQGHQHIEDHPYPGQ
ncbi:hypothetical protein D3C76_740870 [compost metagenome]